MTNVKDCIVIENARIIFRNFSRIETKFNRKGSRNFCVVIENPKFADELTAIGWNIRTLKPREPEDEATSYLPVQVSFDNVPPKVFLVTKNAKTQLDTDSIGTLDFAEIANVDLVVRPYNWEANGKFGVKAYLKEMYVTIVEGAFADKYANLNG